MRLSKSDKFTNRKICFRFSLISLICYFFYFLLSSSYSPLSMIGVKSPFFLIILSFSMIFCLPLFFIYTHFHSEHKLFSKNKITNEELKMIFLPYKLTKREQEIAALVFEGLTNQEIEEKLFLSLQTVKNYISRIYQKLSVKNRLDLISFVRSKIEFL